MRDAHAQDLVALSVVRRHSAGDLGDTPVTEERHAVLLDLSEPAEVRELGEAMAVRVAAQRRVADLPPVLVRLLGDLVEAREILDAVGREVELIRKAPADVETFLERRWMRLASIRGPEADARSRSVAPEA